MSYKTIYKQANGELIEKKSKFIANCKPVSSKAEAEEFIAQIRKEHSTATHNVFAYRVMEQNMLIERQSDDGEPSGTAGMPILNLLKGENLIGLVVLVTRYYGGTLLGTGGLVKAYGGCAKLGVIEAGIIEKNLYHYINVETVYTLSGKVQNEISQSHHILKDIVYTDCVEFLVYTKAEDSNNFIKEMTDITGGNAKIKTLEEIYGFWLNGEFYPS